MALSLLEQRDCDEPFVFYPNTTYAAASTAALTTATIYTLAVLPELSSLSLSWGVWITSADKDSWDDDAVSIGAADDVVAEEAMVDAAKEDWDGVEDRSRAIVVVGSASRMI